MKILQEYVHNLKPYVVAADNTPNEYDDISQLAWNIIFFGSKSDRDLIRTERDHFRNYVIFQYLQKLADEIFHKNGNSTYTEDDINGIVKKIQDHRQKVTDRLPTPTEPILEKKADEILMVFDNMTSDKIKIILNSFSENAKAQSMAKAVEATSLTDRIKKSVAFFTGKPR